MVFALHRIRPKEMRPKTVDKFSLGQFANFQTGRGQFVKL